MEKKVQTSLYNWYPVALMTSCNQRSCVAIVDNVTHIVLQICFTTNINNMHKAHSSGLQL